jgi:hypothetical protein
MPAISSDRFKRKNGGTWLFTLQTLAIAFWIAALGVFLQNMTNAGHHLRTTTAIILVLFGLTAMYASMRSSSHRGLLEMSLAGLFFAVVVLIELLTIRNGIVQTLQRSQALGPLTGTLMQLTGLLLAAITSAGILIVRRRR